MKGCVIVQNRCFTKYPEGMPDYFKQAFPAGMSYERTFQQEYFHSKPFLHELELKYFPPVYKALAVLLIRN